jgi:hypothetical protein
MGLRASKGIFAYLRRLLDGQRRTSNELAAARGLIAAVDRGGIPFNTLRINAIARDLGLDVSRHALPEETIARIRAAIARTDRHG